MRRWVGPPKPATVSRANQLDGAGRAGDGQPARLRRLVRVGEGAEEEGQHADVVEVEVGEQDQLDVLDAHPEAGEEDVGR